jgi:hypothetical protein
MLGFWLPRWPGEGSGSFTPGWLGERSASSFGFGPARDLTDGPCQGPKVQKATQQARRVECGEQQEVDAAPLPEVKPTCSAKGSTA